MDDLDRIRELAEKVQRGEELTMSEQQEVDHLARAFMAALQPIIDTVMEIQKTVTKIMLDWWESLPEETQSLIKKSVDEPIKSRKELLQRGLLYGTNSLIGKTMEINIHNVDSVNQYMNNPLNKQIQEIQNEQFDKSRESGARPTWIPPSYRSPYC